MTVFDLMPDGYCKISLMYTAISVVKAGEETYYFSHIAEYYYEKHCDKFNI